MEIRRCMRCMRELKPGEAVCPECGEAYGSAKVEPFALKPGTILDGKYLVGEMLGQGGFGITYIGFDLLLEQKIAIKEYFPMSTGMVSRENGTSVVWSSTMMEKSGAEKGFDSFLKEARKMAKLRTIPSVVGVNSVFIQNETAYIVMDFIEGETLLKKLEREGPMDFDTCVSLLAPIMKALAEVHQHGIIHRDISPDNIMVQKDGSLILLDLGAAKDLEIQSADGTSPSSQLVAKHGFSPFEQYGRGEQIGPWTDVYAMAATIYYCCTSCLPPAATDRVFDDTLVRRPRLSQPQFDALALCMTVAPQKRPQDMNTMLSIITPKPGSESSKPEPQTVPETTPVPEPPKTNPLKPKPGSKTALPKWLIPATAGIVALCIAIGIGFGGESEKKPDTNTTLKSTATQTTPVITVPKETAPKETTETTVPQSPQETAYLEAERLLAGGETAKAALAFGKLGDYEDAHVRSLELWKEMTPGEISAGFGHSVGLKRNGTVVAVGSNSYGQCDVSGWTDIVAVSAGEYHTVGLKSDGTVVAVGANGYGRCNVTDWQDIVAISADGAHTVGLKSDGTVVAVGSDMFGQLSVSGWKDIMEASAGRYYTVGLKTDGTVVAVGDNEYDQRYVSGWADIVAVSAGGYYTVGLKSDGTVVAVGDNHSGQCGVSGWRDIVAVSAGKLHTVGLKSNGTVVAVGDNRYGQCDVSGWTDIVAVSAGVGYTLGLKSDGTVVAAGDNRYGQCNVSGWTDIALPGV